MASFQEQYDSLIQQLEEKGIPQPRLLVPAAVIALIAVIYLVAVPSLLPSDVTVQFTLQDAAGKPVANAELTLMAGQKELAATSDSTGKVTFKAVPPNQKLQLRIRASGYVDETKRIGYGDERVTLTALEKPPAEISFSAQILSDQRMPIEAASVRFTLDDGTSQFDVTDPFGEAKARLADTQRVVVEASKDGYQSQRRSVVLANQKTVEIVLEKAAEPTPTSVPAPQSMLVRVSDEAGKPVRGVSVQLLDEQTQTTVRVGTTDAAGESRLDRVNANQAYTVSVTDPQARYYPQSSYSVVPGSEPVTIVLDAAPESDQLVLTLKDKSGNAVADATVTAYDKRQKSYLASVDSDSTGRAALTLGASDTFITVYKEGYLPYTLSARNKDARSVTLESSDGRTVSVRVTVRKHLEPAPESQVQLYSTDGFPLGLPSRFAAADGTVTFDVPKSASAIMAKASLEASKGESDRAVPQSDIEWVINLLPPKVPFRVQVTDAVTRKPVNGATVRFVTSAEKLNCKTQEGRCQESVPAETEFRVIVEHAAYLSYQSTTQLVASDQASVTYDTRLYPKSLTQSATVQFQGFFTPSGQLLRETANAQSVQARFLVSLPSATAQDSGRFGVWLAESPAPIASITAVDGTDLFFTGSDPASACNPPVSDNNSEAGQWAVFEFPKGFSGTQQVSVDFFTQPDARPPSALWIQYTLHGLRSGVPFVYPLDAEKLQQLTALTSISESDFCGQKSTSQRLPISRDVLTCQDQYCSKAVFVTADGRRFSQSATLPAGQTFGLDLDVIGLEAGISQVKISAPRSIQLVSLQVVGAGSNNLSQSNLESADDDNAVTVSVQAAKTEKVRLHLDARAVRASVLAEISIQLEDADGGQATIVRNLVITGTNPFSVTSSLTQLEAGLSENLRVSVKDQFNKPVKDASVELYECEGSPLNGQQLVTSDSRAGTYSFKVQPSTFGTVGIRVSHPQFVTYEECVLPVRAVDFLEAEPESVLLKGDTQKATVSESITLTTLLDVKSTVTSTVKCTDANDIDAAAPFTLSPKSFTLKDTSTVKLQANVQSFKGRCDVTFLAKINKDNVAADLVSIDVELKGPPAADRLCPTTQEGVKCLAASEAAQLRCTKTSFICEDAASACYQCNLGSQTLPGQISLSVSNYQSDATQTYAIALEDNPEECRVEGFTNNPAYGAYGYNNPYGQNPYGYQTGYSAPNSYYAYRPNPYTPYATNPYQMPGACMPYSGGYPYGPNYASAYSSTYPSGYAGAVNPAYSGGFVPSNTPANPASPIANCQAIIAKLSPYCQPYFTQYSQYNTNQNFYSNSYRDPWSNTLNPTYPSPSSFQYPQQRATVNVQADCTRTELRVTAQYTGGDTNYGGALGGNQQGFLLVRTGGQTKQIPITVVVQTPFGPGQYPGSYPGGYNPGGYPSNQIPPQCLLEYQQAVQTAYQTPNATGQEGLDDSGLPDSIDVYYNKYTGQGTYERELKAPAGGTLSLVKPTSAQVKMDVTGSKLRVSVQCKKAKEGTFECPDSVPFKATWTFANLQSVQKERTIRISQDDFSPSVIQLLATKETKDQGIFDVSTSGDFAKAKCKAPAGVKCRPADSQISAESSSAIKDGKLEITNLGDYQIRTIPVRASTIVSSIIVKAGEGETKYDFSGPLTATPTCEVVNADKSDVKTAIVVTCTTESIKVKPTEGITTTQNGRIEVSFEDSERNYGKVNFKPTVLLTVEGKGPDVQIVLNAVDPQYVGQAFTASYKFPAGDDKSRRSITLTLQDASGKQMEQQRKEASQLQDEGTVSAEFTKPGTVIIRADTVLNGKAVLETKQVKYEAATTTPTTPTTETQPPADPNVPGGPAKVASGILEYILVVPNPNSIRLQVGLKGSGTEYAAAKQKWAKYDIYVKENPGGKVRRDVVKTRFDASSGSGEGFIGGSSGGSYTLFKPYTEFKTIQEYAEAHPSDSFYLVIEAFDSSGATIGKVEQKTSANALGVKPASGGVPPAPAPGGPGSPPPVGPGTPSTVSASNRCVGNGPNGVGGTQIDCWISDRKAAFRCTDFLDNGFGLCANYVTGSEAGFSVSGGDGYCGTRKQSNLNRYHSGNSKNCGLAWTSGVWSFKVGEFKTFEGVEGVMVHLSQQGGGLKRFDRTPLRNPHCGIQDLGHVSVCTLKLGVASQRCSEATGQGAAVCLNSIEQSIVGNNQAFLKVVSPYGSCGYAGVTGIVTAGDDGIIRKGLTLRGLEAGDYDVSCNYAPKFTVSVTGVTRDAVQLIVKDV